MASSKVTVSFWYIGTLANEEGFKLRSQVSVTVYKIWSYLEVCAVEMWGKDDTEMVYDNSVFGFYARRKSNGDCIVVR